MCNNITLSQEEKFIKLIDKYITQHRDNTINAVFYRKLYVLFVGYHLKYYYSSKQYCNSCFHVDNIMQMFTGVVSSLKANANKAQQQSYNASLLEWACGLYFQ